MNDCEPLLCFAQQVNGYGKAGDGEFYDKKLLTKVAYGHSQIVACGEKVRENLVDWFGLKKDRVVVLRNAVEKDERYNPIEEIEKLRSENFNCFIVGYVGRISREKGVDALVRALAKVVTKKRYIFGHCWRWRFF